MRRHKEFVVEVLDEGTWQDCGEGPFRTKAAALTFAYAEVGLPWRIVMLAPDLTSSTSQYEGRVRVVVGPAHCPVCGCPRADDYVGGRCQRCDKQ